LIRVFTLGIEGDQTTENTESARAPMTRVRSLCSLWFISSTQRMNVAFADCHVEDRREKDLLAAVSAVRGREWLDVPLGPSSLPLLWMTVALGGRALVAPAPSVIDGIGNHREHRERNSADDACALSVISVVRISDPSR
jgi:prepilin-type processing-associated H-X9-DG protein